MYYKMDICKKLFRYISVEAEDLKKLASTLNALANEKVKLQKAQAVSFLTSKNSGLAIILNLYKLVVKVC